MGANRDWSEELA